jgi:hypothetical protein
MATTSAAVDGSVVFQIGKHMNRFRFYSLQAVFRGNVLGISWRNANQAWKCMEGLCNRSVGDGELGQTIHYECSKWKVTCTPIISEIFGAAIVNRMASSGTSCHGRNGLMSS